MSERGAAGIVINLKDGGITIRHAEAGVLLRSFSEVSEGTWELMFDTITNLLEERLIR